MIKQRIIDVKEVTKMTRMLDIIPMTGSLLPGGGFFESFFEDLNLAPIFGERQKWVPAFDITENDKEYLVTAELPGINVKDLEVTLSDNILSIKGEKKHENEDKGADYHRVERSYGSFHRSFHIPEKIFMDKIDAAYKDGILKLTLPKAESAKAKKIDVKEQS